MRRDLFWDSLKFFLIILVVYGHMIETYVHNSSFNQAMYNFIYLFHMPFFIFISGRFSQMNDKVKYRKGIIRLFETYVVFQIIKCLKPIFLGNSLIFGFHLLYPKGTLWYLACLIIYRLFIYLIPSTFVKERSLLILFSSFFIGLLWGYLPFSISHRIVAFFPYFLMGYYSKDINITFLDKKLPFITSIIGLFSIFLIIYFFLNYSIDYIEYCDRSYLNDKTAYSPHILCIARFLLYLSVILTSILIMRVFLKKKYFPKLGSKTLFIYLYHTFFVLILRSLIAKEYLIQNEFLLFLYAIIIIVLLVIMSHLRILNILLNPVSFFVNRKHLLSHKKKTY